MSSKPIKGLSMIGYLYGKVLFSDGEETLLLTEAGIGHQIHFGEILAEGVLCGLYISHIFRETGEELYGFKKFSEKRTFEWLLKVRGVGPKSASSLIRFLGTAALTQAIEQENKKILQQVPGIGPKAAAQIILDLKSKISQIMIYQEGLTEGKSSAQCLGDALLACKELGYADKDILPLAQKIMGEHSIQRPEQLVHLILKEL